MVQPLTVLTILHGEQGYVFQVESPEARGAAALNMVVQATSPQALRQLEAAVEAAAHTQRLLSGLDRRQAPGRTHPAADPLRQLGRLMHDLLLPLPIQSFLGELTRHTPLLISTDDASLPWELVHDGAEFLALKCPVGRRFLSVEPARCNPPEPHAGKNLLLIADPAGDLPKASEEITALMDLLDALPEWSKYEVLARQGAAKTEVLNCLAAGHWDLIHYSGHIALDESRSQAVSLCLANGERLTAEEIRRAVRGRPLIFLNGCSTSKEKMNGPDGPGNAQGLAPYAGLPVHGLASAFLLSGAKGFIGTLWPVYDEAAYHFALHFYRLALRGEPVGGALREAREATRQEHPADPIWASFVLYGDPTWRIADFARQERRLVTSLHARLGGLTELFRCTSLEEAANIQEAGLKLLARQIVEYGGKVSSLSHAGLEATFGAPLAYGDDAQRAAWAAWAMLQAWEKFNRDVARKTSASLGLSLALSTGHAITGEATVGDRLEYTVRGDAVDQAVRLGEQAPAGQVWVEEHTYRLVNRTFDLAPLEPAPPEGERTIYRLRGPRPQRPDAITRASPFVGRQEQLAALEQGWQKALHGEGALVTVAGVAGVGKSRLVETWRAGLTGVPCRWIVGACQAQTSRAPYRLLSVVLRQLFGLEAADDQAAAQAKIKSAVDRLAHAQGLAAATHVSLALALLGDVMGLELVAAPAGDLDAGAHRGQLARVIRGLLAQETVEAPLVIILEDVHWIDEASLAVIDRLAEGIAHLPVLLIALYRTPWQHNWTARARHEIVLDHLTEDESRKLLGDLLETPTLPPGLADAVLSTAGGSPLFLKEMVRSLVETGALIRSNGIRPNGVRSSGFWRATEKLEAARIPATIQGTLQARIDRLGQNEQQLLRLAGVLGLEFSLKVLSAMSRSFEGLDVDDGLDVLCRHEFLVERAWWPEMHYAFHHALIQQVAYESLVAKERKLLHRLAGQALEALYAGEEQSAQVEQLAYHYYEGEAWAPALDHQLRAGEKALALFAHETAKAYFERAQALIASGRLAPRQEQRLTCFESLGDIDSVQGHFEAAREHYQAALDLPGGEVAAAADLCRKMAQTYERQGQFDLALEWLQRGLSRRRDQPDDAVTARLYLLQGIIDARQGRLDQAFVGAERAMRSIEGTDELAEAAQASNLMGVVYRSRGQLDQAAECCRRSAELYESIHNPLKAAAAYSNLGVVAFEQGDWPGAETAYRQSLKLQESTDDAYGQSTTHCNLADLLWRLGRLEQALTHAQTGLRLADELGADYVRALAHLNLGAIYLRQGKPGPAVREHLEISWRLLEDGHVQEQRSEIQSLLAESYLREGQIDMAEQAAGQAIEIALKLESSLDEEMARRILDQVHRMRGSQETDAGAGQGASSGPT